MKLKLENPYEWNRCFIWFPTITIDRYFVWLCYAERKYNDDLYDECNGGYEYRIGKQNA